MSVKHVCGREKNACVSCAAGTVLLSRLAQLAGSIENNGCRLTTIPSPPNSSAGTCAALAATGFRGRQTVVGIDLGTTYSVVGVNEVKHVREA